MMDGLGRAQVGLAAMLAGPGRIRPVWRRMRWVTPWPTGQLESVHQSVDSEAGNLAAHGDHLPLEPLAMGDAEVWKLNPAPAAPKG